MNTAVLAVVHTQCIGEKEHAILHVYNACTYWDGMDLYIEICDKCGLAQMFYKFLSPTLLEFLHHLAKLAHGL